VKIRLGVNIDHVATVRNARGGAFPIRCVRRCSPRKRAPTASPRICAKTADISDDDIERLRAQMRGDAVGAASSASSAARTGIGKRPAARVAHVAT